MKSSGVPLVPQTERAALADRYGWRPTSGWGDGPIPAPYAEGDVVFVRDSSPLIGSKGIPSPGLYVVSTVVSISESDLWYVKLARPGAKTDRVYVGSDKLFDSAGLVGVDLIESSDPDGAGERMTVVKSAKAHRRVVRSFCPQCGHSLHGDV